jgi:hypothetical protein
MIGDEDFRGRQHIEQHGGALVDAHLPFGQQQGDGAAPFVANRVEFGVQAAFGVPDAAREFPFLCRLAAVR